MPKLMDRQLSLTERYYTSTDPKERAAISRQMRNSEYGGMDGEQPRMPDGVLINGVDRNARARAEARERQIALRAREAQQGRHPTPTPQAHGPKGRFTKERG